MLFDMLTDLRHGVAHIRIRVQQLVVLLRVPLGEGGQLLRDGLEQPDNNPDGSGLHVGAELVNGGLILVGVSR